MKPVLPPPPQKKNKKKFGIEKKFLLFLTVLYPYPKSLS